ncbi:riboflavin synthase domain-like protein, partial [Tilletiaria anomala UBC 951]
PNAWKPFGNGKRACIGRGFAIQEALLALALIVNRFDIEMADPTYDLRLRQTLTIKPDDFKIIAKPRFRNQNLLHELLVGVRLANVTQQKEQQPQQKQVSPLPSTTGAAPSAPAEGARITFLYGSNSGSCESLAKELSSEGKARGFATTVGELDQLAGNGKLSTTEPVVICTASYEGKPCDNAKAFVDAISAMDAATAPLKGVKYIVFGAGHSDWATTFHKIPIFIDDQLAKLGAERLMPLSKADAAGDVLGDFESFKENVWKHLAAPSPSSSVSGPSASPGTALGVSVAAPDDKLGHIDKVGTVLDSVQLVPAREAREGKRHVKIRLPEGQTYRSGDYLAVLPKNPPQVIERVLRHFGVDPASQIVLSKSNRAFLPKDTPIRADNLFGSLLELAQPVSKRTLTELIELCEAEADQAKIRAMVGGYQQQVLAKRVSLLDVLVSTPGAKADLAFFLENLPKMKIRQYSISSTPLLDSETVTLSFNVVQGPSLSGHGSYYGVASTYLASLKHGDKLNCSVKPSADFHLPVDPSVPIVMFASGSGLAPFRGFIAERALMRQSGRNVGPTVLYYGSSGEEDVLHREELLQWKQSGDLDLRLVFSSLEEANAKAQQYDLVEGCKYVQHRVWAERADIVQLFDDGAQLFLCGSGQRLGAGVRKVLIDITRERKGCSESEAKETMERLSKNRYKTDVFL